ncbi:hypothetical protein PHMEG_00030523 [Phytophthora megakarya]|uniref:Uncharacterized protein n=1 Tax=Phytophthora megakarya TaxID=4795 RepID=A0A225V1R5_9STRA|nr:hypothetical protein PHMEG_00030523 [Phytophthora megakarya]
MFEQLGYSVLRLCNKHSTVVALEVHEVHHVPVVQPVTRRHRPLDV